MAASTDYAPVQQSYVVSQPGILAEWQFDHQGFINKLSKFGCLDAFFRGWGLCDCLLPWSAPFCCLQQVFGILPIYRVVEYFLRSKPNLVDKANAIHIGFSDRGVCYIIEKHTVRHVCSEEEIPRADFLYPFEEITDVIVKEPYSNCCVDEPLWTATVTAINRKPLYINGIMFAENFKSEVFRLKAARMGGAIAGQPGQIQMVMAPPAQQPQQQPQQLLQQQQQQQQHAGQQVFYSQQIDQSPQQPKAQPGVHFLRFLGI